MSADQPRPVPWDGHGLPPQAQLRMERAARSKVAGSLLSAPEAAALAAVGFSPVGEVMGCIVQHAGWAGYGCGYAYGWNASRTVSSGSATSWAGLTPYVKAVYEGWHTALRRLVQEATALGADGVVGIRLSETHLGGSNREFLALGTAVRTDAATATRPFTTDLSGSDVSKLLHAGWVPTGIAIGIAAGVRHDDYGVRNQTSTWGNTQVDGYTDLVNTVRHDARDQFERRAREHGGETVMVSSMKLRVWENEPSDNHRDHYAEALFIGTTATSFHRGAVAPTRSLSILPLDRTRETAS
ncbi:heavy metal-binding domain-containing protein [Nocardioides panacihumi]|uniref:heavy metal-binding domain-containing protein n=1 Tax=Nocardioides panacihumi TaxID=400774 RepID=UPI0031D3971A